MKNTLQRLTYIFLVLIIFTPFAISGQSKFSDSRISPTLEKKISFVKNTDSLNIILTIKPDRKNIFNSYADNFKIVYSDNSYAFIRARFTKENILELLQRPEVIFIESAERQARPEQMISSLDLGTNEINYLHHRDSIFDGKGETVSIKEYTPDTNDIDIRGRYIRTDLASENVNSHATVMTTLICGAGNTWYTGRGAARGAKYTSSSYDVLLPDPGNYYQQYGINIQNHSYGVAIENYYAADAAAYDQTSVSNNFLQHIFSSGNSGTSISFGGRYAGIVGYSNLTGSFKMAKNILTVGATDSFNIISAASSRGPSYDGRIAPSIVAFGEDGSSGAAALVSGTGLILEQLYRNSNNSSLPNTLLRAALINGAIDRGNPGPDYIHGYGSLNALNSFNTIKANHYFEGNTSQGNSSVFNLAITPGASSLKLTLTWNDVPAQPNALKALVNDLDLQLTNNSTGETWNPWILSNFPSVDSLRKNAVRGIDTLNNIEQISVQSPPPGNYSITVRGTRITTPVQQFHIAYQVDTASTFTWTYPTGSDPVLPAESNIIRWKTTYNSTGKIEYSLNNGNTWTTIQDNVPLSTSYYRWIPPATASSALLRMVVNTNSFESDRFTIAARTETRVSFNCADSFGFAWNKLHPSFVYRIYELGDKYLEPFMETTDSFIVLKKPVHPSLHYSVAPLIDGLEATRSFTFNYTQQGVFCYFSSFISELVNNSVKLNLTLGSIYNIDLIVIEKWNGSAWISLQQITASALQYEVFDQSLLTGANRYRIKLVLNTGDNIYSQEETIYFFGETDYIVFPNPARQSEVLNIGVKEVDFSTAVLYSASGARVSTHLLDERVNRITTSRMAKGIYFLKIISPGKRIYTTTVVIL